jgi:DNA-binding transcriptional MerR regulator
MKIGQLAKAAGVGVSAVRFYEAQGLMPKPPTRDSGYREYEDSDLERLRFIVAAKRLRFPLKLIRVALDALDTEPRPCEGVARLVRERVTTIDRELRDLQRLRRHLTAQLVAWERCALPTAECLCAILQTVAPRHPQQEKPMPKIEIFTAGCKDCDEAARIVREAVAPCGCEVVTLPVDGPEAKARGVRLAPCVWKDGEFMFCGLPTLDEAVAKLRCA